MGNEELEQGGNRRHPLHRGLPGLERAKVAELMRPGVLMCQPDASLRTVARTMAMYRVHAVVVADVASGEPERVAWTVVSDVDLVRATADDLEGRTAGDVASGAAYTVDVDSPLTSAVRLMSMHGVNHLVVTRERRPVGMLSSLDIADSIAWGS